jgi:hypothetical protein
MIAIPEYKNSTSPHPLTDITLGEGLIKETYEAIRGSVATTCALAYSRFCFRERLLTAPLEGILGNFARSAEPTAQRWGWPLCRSSSRRPIVSVSFCGVYTVNLRTV